VDKRRGTIVLLTHEITVPGSAEQVFALFNDVERVASCMPGATLDGRDGDAYLGQVTVKIGPIAAAYAGSVRFAAVDLLVSDTPAGALVQITTDLVISGKIAQFGKGAIATVSDRILRQFAENLGTLLTRGGPSEPDRRDPLPAQGPPRPAPAELDGLSLLLGPTLAKYAPLAAAFAVGLAQGWLVSRAFGRRPRCVPPSGSAR
jgi:carbon monoxide dehydrogenase subunit G